MKRMVNNAEKTNNLIRTSYVLPSGLLSQTETFRDASKSAEGRILINFHNEVTKSLMKLGKLNEFENSYLNYEKAKNCPLGIVTTETSCWLIMSQFDALDDIFLVSPGNNSTESVTITYEKDRDIVSVTYENEEFVTNDNIKTIFGQSITGTGNITLYRHQIAIRFDIDTKEVHYVVYSSNNAQITNYDDFIAVAKPISNFNYTAVYVNGNNAEPAFIRFASGTILVGLSTGMEPYTGVADTVSSI